MDTNTLTPPPSLQAALEASQRADDPAVKQVRITGGRLAAVDNHLKAALIQLGRAEDLMGEMLVGKQQSSSEVVVALRNLRTKLNPVGATIVETKADLKDLAVVIAELL